MLPTETTTVKQIIPSYLYTQYNDDDNLQAFVIAFNQLAQQYLDWLNTINLPIYTSPLITGSLLDWVLTGVYGIVRPTLRSGKAQAFGPYNAFQYNQIAYNTFRIVGAVNFFQTNDDFYKRIATWIFYKGDGFQFSIPWLKRRVQRFLNGENGTDAGTDQTYPVSITFDTSNAVTIDISAVSTNPAALILQEAVKQNAVPMPFQYTFTVLV